jgi:hypothetical protein
LNALLSPADAGLSITGGKLRIAAGLRIFLPDLAADPGHMRATSYNHAVTVKVIECDIAPMPDGYSMVAWGKAGDRRAVVVRQAMADELRAGL